MADRARWLGPAALVGSIVLLGANWPVMKLALRDCTPLWLAAVRIGLAGLLYLALLAARRQLAWPAAREWPVIVVLGVCQGAILTGLVTEGVALVGAGRSAILAYTMPIWMIPGAALLLHERASRAQMAGLACGLLGMLVLFSPLDFDWGSRRVLLGNACVLIGALAWSGGLLAARAHVWRMSPLQTMPYQMLVGAAVLLPAAMWVEGGSPRYALSAGFLLGLAYIAAGATFLAYWMVVEAARRLPAARVSLGQLATPVLGVAVSAAWAGESPGGGDLLGLALILLGVCVSAAWPASPAPASPAPAALTSAGAPAALRRPAR